MANLIFIGRGEKRDSGSHADNNMASIKLRYVATLVKLFEAKAEKGELDEALMGKIEKLLEV